MYIYIVLQFFLTFYLNNSCTQTFFKNYIDINKVTPLLTFSGSATGYIDLYLCLKIIKKFQVPELELQMRKVTL